MTKLCITYLPMALTLHKVVIPSYNVTVGMQLECNITEAATTELVTNVPT